MKFGKLLHVAAFAMALSAPSAQAAIIYDSIPEPLPPDTDDSLFYFEDHLPADERLTEIGDYIRFAGTERQLTTATITLSNWAYESLFQNVGTSSGYSVNLTLTIYNVDPNNPEAKLGTSIGWVAKDVLIPWRPEPDSTSTCQPNDYLTSTGCYRGQALTIDFAFPKLSVPDEIIYGLAFDTSSPGPSRYLNLAQVNSPSVGVDIVTGNSFDDYSAGTLFARDSIGPFLLDTYEYTLAARFSAVPEPATLALLSLGLAGLGYARRRRKVAG